MCPEVQYQTVTANTCVVPWTSHQGFHNQHLRVAPRGQDIVHWASGPSTLPLLAVMSIFTLRHNNLTAQILIFTSQGRLFSYSFITTLWTCSGQWVLSSFTSILSVKRMSDQSISLMTQERNIKLYLNVAILSLPIINWTERPGFCTTGSRRW